MKATSHLHPFLLAAALLAVACAGHRGRIMGDEEAEVVAARRAGAATFDRLIEETVEKLFQHHKEELGPTKTIPVAFVDVINRSDEELGPARDDMVQLIETKINHFPGYKTVSGHYVGAALRETRLNAEKLFLPASRRQFLAVLEREDNPAGALLFATVTNVRSKAGDVSQVNYTLSLELVDTATGRNFRESTRVRKLYTK